MAFITRSIPHYRTPFFEGLRDTLDERGVDLTVTYGVGSGTFSERRDLHEPDWAIPTRSWGTSGRFGRIVYQHALPHVRGADLIVMPQQTQLLVLYPLLAEHLLGGRLLAMWGHGRNFQEWRANSAAEAVKRWMSRRVHWWFAYNELSAEIVRDLGFPAERITDVRNAIDTRELVEARAATDEARLDEVRRVHGIDRDRSGHVGVYAGGLYADKRLPVLIAAADRIRDRVPSFELVVMGAGSHQHLVEAAAAERDWLHYLGPRFGEEKVAVFELSSLLLMPGLVGLSVLDAFTLGTPLVTLADSPHSPEIAYLRDGENGVVVDPAGAEDPAEQYADAVVALLADEARRQRLVQGCADAAERYSIEEMVRRFADGITAALQAPPRRGAD